MDIEIKKKCTLCHETKPKSLFKNKGIKDNRCKKCISYRETKYRERSRKNKKLLEVIATSLLSACRARTRRRNLAKEKPGEVTITHGWVLNKLKLGFCEGSYPPLRFVFDNPGSAFSPSLDRIDSANRDYSPNNVRVVCVGINQARSNYKDQDILKITESLSGFIRKRRNSI